MTSKKGLVVIPHSGGDVQTVECLGSACDRRTQLVSWLIAAPAEELADLEAWMAGRDQLGRFRALANTASAWADGSDVAFPHTEDDDEVGLLAAMLTHLVQETTAALDEEEAARVALRLV
jgi:hypothetical protein